MSSILNCSLILFFFNDTATTEIYTLSLHDALPISRPSAPRPDPRRSRSAPSRPTAPGSLRSEEHTSELQSHSDLVCRLLLEKKKKIRKYNHESNVNNNTHDNRENTSIASLPLTRSN